MTETPVLPEELTVDVQVPFEGKRAIEPVLAALREAPLGRPYSDELVELCGHLSRVLSKKARGVGELQALAFWMRKAELRRMAEEVASSVSSDVLLSPRGTVFHIAPANVDTMFAYSWIPALITGNRNIVRLPTRGSPDIDAVVEVVNDVLADYPHVRRATLFLQYGHDQAITAALSLAADTRVIWGGDETVRMVRECPLEPHAIDVTFPDRVSMAVLNAASYTGLNPTAGREAAHRFFRDVYSFDQMACSSPRVLVWIGSREHASRASAAFFATLADVARERRYQVDVGSALAKLTAGHRAVLDAGVERLEWVCNEVTVASAQTASVPEVFPGAGFFYQYRCEKLNDLLPFVNRRVQTVTHLGFGVEELREFAVALNGCGVDRMVPLGDALTFGRYWDGYDLALAFTKRVHIVVR